MSFKETVKNQLTLNLQTKLQQKIIVDNLQTEILRCINEVNIPPLCSVDYNTDWNDDEVNMLKMLIKTNINIDCDVNYGKIWCSLINFLT